MKPGILLTLCIFFALQSCKKEEAPFSTTPEIAFNSVKPLTAQAFKDSITFEFKYKDGDGDLGENSAVAENLFLTDNRINLVYKFRIKQLSPSGKATAIHGSLSVVLPNTTITHGSNVQNATFSLYVINRARKKSNVITSGPVAITE